MNLKIKIIKTKKELKSAFNIRNIVFGKEQKIPRKIDFDGLDNKTKQILVLYNNKPIGTARIRFIQNRAKLERIALLKKYRGRGLGEKLMNFLIDYCKKKEIKEIYFHAQCYLKDFYKKFGFKIRGKSFIEAGKIKHIEMYLKN